MERTSVSSIVPILVAVLMILAACDDGANQSGGASPPEVTALTVAQQTVALERIYPARARAADDVEVRAQLEGILIERTYEEGNRVEAGTVLFRIDPAPYEARVQRAKAELDRARAQLRQAQRQWKRASELYEKSAVSARQRDEALSAVELAEAGVANAEALLHTARIDLGYSEVKAPISGVTGLRAVSNGNLVTSGALLTTIRQLDPMHVLFSMPEADAIALRRRLNSAGEGSTSVHRLTARVRLADGSDYERQGIVDFIAAYVDPQTGTVQARADFPNPQGVLMPGQFLRISVQGLELRDAIVIPAKAVAEGPQGPVAYVLNEQNVVRPQPVTLGPSVAQDQVIEQGLQAGERVVVGGIAKVRPGQPVRPAPSAEAAGQRNGEAATDGGANPETGR
ncbi:efflux RND transporter periplasmic adaptor subunit [Tepidicaulis sp. LMO-SS28]|uniref:efflux RND transporter periplasmic adaptor subunit n=1 Tax=Tepidicaulis sp. LMO-SS28 TaxID=3447455 RepID=UPI003EDF3155